MSPKGYVVGRVEYEGNGLVQRCLTHSRGTRNSDLLFARKSKKCMDIA